MGSPIQERSESLLLLPKSPQVARQMDVTEKTWVESSPIKERNLVSDAGESLNPAERHHVEAAAEKASHAVCFVFTPDPSKRGTGCLVGGSLLLTNHHVIPDKETAEKCQVLFYHVVSQDTQKEETLVKIVKIGLNPTSYFFSSPNNVEILKDPKDSTKTIKIIQPADKYHLDFTLVALKLHPALAAIQDKTFSLFKTVSIKEKSWACIVHHPEELDPKTLLKADIKWSSGKVQQIKGCSLHYDTPTKEGSSGGAVIDLKGNLIALHHQSLGKTNYDPQRPFSNAGVLLKKIGKALVGEREAIDKRIEEVKKDYSNKIKALSEHLIFFYKEQLTAVYKVKAKGAWQITLPIEGVYTNLSIIGQEEKKEQNDLKQPFQDRRIPTHETLFKSKTPIDLQDIFKHEKLTNIQQKRAVIFGVAGVGKTTFCQMAAINGVKLWPEFNAVFLIKLRNLNEKKYKSDGYTPYGLLAKECSFNLPDYKNLLEDQGFRNKSLLILDGYDEIPKELEEEGDLGKAFQKLKALFPHILITSRPTMVDIDYAYELEIVGFGGASIRTYIEKFYRLLAERGDISKEEAKRKTRRLREEIEKRPILASLVQISINLSLACSLFMEDEAFFDSNQTLSVTTFYIEAVNWFYKRYQLRPGKSSHLEANIRQQRNPRKMNEKVNRLAIALEEIAWQAMKNNTLYFDQDALEEVLHRLNLDLQDATDMGLLSIEADTGQFIHLTFQEFFAAANLAYFYLEGKQKKAKQIIAEKKFEPRYTLVFWMTAGYISNYQMVKEPAALQNFFDDLLSEPYDLAVSYELSLIARCFEECKNPNQIRQYPDFVKIVADYLLEQITKKNPVLDMELLGRSPRVLREEKILGVIIEQLYENNKEYVIPILRKVVETGQALPLKIIKILVNMVNDPKSQDKIRERTIRALGEMAKRGQKFSEKTIEAFSKELANQNAPGFLREMTSMTLGEIAKSGQKFPEETIRTLATMLTDPKSGECLQKSVVGALRNVCEAGQVLPGDVINLVSKFTSSKSENKLEKSIYNNSSTLKKMEKTDQDLRKETAPALISILTNLQESENVREKAASLLGEAIKTDYTFFKEVIIALTSSMTDPKSEDYLKRSSADALIKVVKIGQPFPKEAVEVFSNALTDLEADYNIRWWSARILKEMDSSQFVALLPKSSDYTIFVQLCCLTHRAFFLWNQRMYVVERSKKVVSDIDQQGFDLNVLLEKLERKNCLDPISWRTKL